MRKLFYWLLSFILFTSVYVPVNAQQHTGEIIVKFKNNADIGQAISESIKSFNAKIDQNHFTVSNFRSLINNNNSKYFVASSTITKLYRFKNDRVSIDTALQMLRKNSAVEFAEPDYNLQLSAISNDPDYGKQWHLPKINAPQAWDKTTGSSSIIVAIIDSGVDYNHSDLAPNMWHNSAGQVGYDFGSNDTDPMDVQGHGTHMAGVIGAVGNNNNGGTGINWNVKLMAIKAVGLNAVLAPASTVASSIIYATDNGAKVINMSFGAPGIYSQTVANAIDYAYSKGVVLVASAGNYVCPVWFPANHPKVIAAGATDQYDNHPGFSCEGDALDLTAPSVSIISAEKGGGYTTGENNTGTSYSAAMVSGAAALVLANEPYLSNTDVINRLETTADDLGTPGRDNTFGYGRINLAKAVGANSVTPTPSPTQSPQSCMFKTTAVVKDQYGNILNTSGQNNGLRMEWKFTAKDGKYYEGSSYFNNGKIGPDTYNLEPKFRDIQAEVVLHVDRNKWDLQEEKTFCTDKTSNKSCISASKQTVLQRFVCGVEVEYGWVLKTRNGVEPMPTILYPTPTTQPPTTNKLSVYTNVGEGANVQVGQVIKVCYTVPQPGRFTFSRITNTWQRSRSYIDDGRGDCFLAQIANPAGRHMYRIEMNGEVRETYINVIPCSTPGVNFYDSEESL